MACGREGLLGISVILGNPARDNRADVQSSGLAFRISTSVVKNEAGRQQFSALAVDGPDRRLSGTKFVGHVFVSAIVLLKVN
jgi:hypothetical protein